MKDSTIIKMLYALILSSFLIILTAFLGSRFEKVVLFNEDVVMFNKGWKYELSGKEPINLSIPFNLDMPENSTLRISNILPEHYVEGMSLSTMTTLQTLRIFVNNKIIYNYGFNEKWRFGDGSGGTYHIVRLPKGTQGQQITIELSSHYRSQIGELPYITLGSKSANMFFILSKQFVPFVLCFITLLIGLAYLILHLYIDLLFKGSNSLLYLGLFTVFASIWSITETGIMQFIFPYESIEYIVTYLSLMLTPIPLLLYLKGSTHSSKNNLINVLCIFQMINFIGTNILCFFHITNYRALLPITHTVIVFSLALVVYTVGKEIFYYKNKDSWLFGIAISILGIFVLIELIEYTIFDNFNISIYFRSGLLIFVVLTGLSTTNRLIETVKKGINAKAIEDLAYTDILTGIYNRTAFARDIDDLNRHLNSSSRILTIMFDMNYLKDVNDRFGHKAGDALLIQAASFIWESFENAGRCYRIGGDEFAVILKDKCETTVKSFMNTLDDHIKEYNQKSNILLELPYGYACYDPGTDKDLYGTFHRADQQMYIAKEKSKSHSIR